jgi:hypothetical protein
LNPADGVVLADVGRVDSEVVTRPVIAAYHAVIVIVEGTISGVARLRARLNQLRALAGLGTKIGIVVAEREYTAAEVNAVFLMAGPGVPPFGSLGPLGFVAPGTHHGRRARRVRRLWEDLAETVRAVAEAEPRLALAASPEHAAPTEAS